MTTALTVIEKALSKIGVRSREISLTSNEISDAIEDLNDMMYEWDADGINLGYTTITSSSDTVTTPDWSMGAIKSNLAIRLAPDYDKQVSNALVVSAQQGYETLINRSIELDNVDFPDTLAKGSGNTNVVSYTNRFFITNNENELTTGVDFLDDEVSDILLDDEGDE